MVIGRTELKSSALLAVSKHSEQEQHQRNIHDAFHVNPPLVRVLPVRRERSEEGLTENPPLLMADPVR
jgi:hypothetical protein